MGKYKDAYEALQACVDEFDNEEENLSETGKYYKQLTLRLIHQIASYTDRPPFPAKRPTRK